jgi:hypothetical protein
MANLPYYVKPANPLALPSAPSPCGKALIELISPVDMARRLYYVSTLSELMEAFSRMAARNPGVRTKADRVSSDAGILLRINKKFSILGARAGCFPLNVGAGFTLHSICMEINGIAMSHGCPFRTFGRATKPRSVLESADT